jgi:predicted Zn finger-like uncharacterized protein
MILTCPQCAIRYLLPAIALSPEGRHVKCSECDEIWFEMPDARELAEYQRSGREIRPEDIEMRPIPEGEAYEGNAEHDEDDSDADSRWDESTREHDIPEGVKPKLEKDEAPSFASFLSEAPPPQMEPLRAKMGGYGAAACVFLVILTVLLTAHSTILMAWPASASLYKAFGITIAVPGEGIVFDKLVAQAVSTSEGREMITLEGQLINLTRNELSIPAIEASLRTADGKSLEVWPVEIEESSLAAEGVLSFTTQYEAQEEEGSEVQIRLTLAPVSARH